MDIRNHEPIIDQVAQGILDLVSPTRIILYNCKRDLTDEVTSFKLCVVMNQINNKGSILRQIYDEIDCEIPFDVLLYTNQQFEDLKMDAGAFANRVDQKGKVLYGE